MTIATRPEITRTVGTLAALSLLATLLVFAGPAAAQERQKLDEIVALVEDRVILRSELDEAIDSIRGQIQARGESMPPRQAMEQQVLERLIRTSLEVQRAESSGIRISDAEVDRTLQQVAQQNNMTMSQLRVALQEDGYDMDDFREEIREDMLTSRLRQQVADSMTEISETEVDILLASEQFGGGEVHLSQILITVPEGANPQQVEQVRDRAREVRGELDEGMEFSSAAMSFSEGPEALEGGELGWRGLNSIPAEVATAMEDMEPGDYTDPIRIPSGFAIIRLNDRRQDREVVVEEYLARHIMVEPSELVTVEEAQLKAESILNRIQAGEDFEELAREYSDDETSANLGGRLNWFPAGRYGQQIQDQIEDLEPGQTSGVFQIGNSWHIVRLEDVREADRTEQTARNEARQMLHQQRSEEEVERFLREMRGESFVEIRL